MELYKITSNIPGKSIITDPDVISTIQEKYMNSDEVKKRSY